MCILGRMTTTTACQAPECSRPVRARGLCATHYQRWRRTGDAFAVGRPGRKPDGRRAAAKSRYTEAQWSARTFARYWTACGEIENAAGPDVLEEVLASLDRPGRPPNVAAVERAVAAVVKGRR